MKAFFLLSSILILFQSTLPRLAIAGPQDLDECIYDKITNLKHLDSETALGLSTVKCQALLEKKLPLSVVKKLEVTKASYRYEQFLNKTILDLTVYNADEDIYVSDIKIEVTIKYLGRTIKREFLASAGIRPQDLSTLHINISSDNVEVVSCRIIGAIGY